MAELRRQTGLASVTPLRPPAPPRVLPAGKVTFLFSDIEGSTALLHAVGQRYAALLDTHRELILGAVALYGGVLVDAEGDGLFIAFSDAGAAVLAARAAQRALHRHPWPDDAPVRVRMGLHTGEAHPVGGDYVALAVHRAARISAAAHGGQVLVSAETVAAADRSLDGIAVGDLGRYRLKDFAEPVRLFQLLDPELPLVELAPRTPPERTHNLRIPQTTFVGRVGELATLAQLLERSRLVSVVGPGGSGKTRLTAELVSGRADSYPDGAWLAELGGVDADGVAGAVAAAAGVGQDADRPVLDTLVEGLRDRACLLVMDNCEHVLDAAANVVAELLAECPQVRVLTTSREPLAADGEVVFRLGTLDVPGDDATLVDLLESDAARLLVDRALQADPGLELGEHDVAAVVRICRRLDGIPLALELAAARLSSMRLPALADGVEKGLPMAGRGRSERQRTLQATLEWSNRLLEPDERAVWRRLAVFVNGFTATSATAVCSDTDLPADRVLPLICNLVDKSLVARVPSRTDEDRFALHHTVREYGLDQLRAAGELDDVTGRFAGWAGGLTRQIAWTWQTKANGLAMDAEQENLLGIRRWLREHEEWDDLLTISATLGFYAANDARHADRQRIIDEALATEFPPTPGGVLLLAQAAAHAHFMAQLDRTESYVARAVAMAEEVGPCLGLANAWAAKAMFCVQVGRWDDALAAFDAMDETYREIGNDVGLRLALGDRVIFLVVVDRLDEAYELALLFRDSARDDGLALGVILALGLAAESAPTSELAAEHLREGIAVGEEAVAEGEAVRLGLGLLLVQETVASPRERARAKAGRALTVYSDPPYPIDAWLALWLARMCEAVGEPARAARWLGARAIGLAGGEADAPNDSRHARELTERLVAVHGEAQVAAWEADGYELDDASVLDTRAAFLAFPECEHVP